MIINKNIKKIKSCEVCGNKKIHSVLNIGYHALCGDLIRIDSKKNNIKYPISIKFCKKCFTAHQEYQINKKKLFPKEYQYRSRLTKDVVNGMKEFVKYTNKNVKDMKNKKIIDIGCNDGTLLDMFSKYSKNTYGVEPTNAYSECKRKHKIYNCFFDLKNAKKILINEGTFDIITFTNVFAHIEDLNNLLNAIKLISHDKTTLVIENHYLGSIVKNFQFDTFYHEHPRSYSLNSFNFISKNLNMRIKNFTFPKRYGGNIRVILTQEKVKKNNVNKLKKIIRLEKNFFKDLKKFKNKILQWKINKTNELKLIHSKYGKIRAKAFPGRAAIPIEILGNTNFIEFVYEKNDSLKIGHYVPGTRIKIIKDKNFNIKDKSPILNLAWHIHDEIVRYMRGRGFKGKIIPIINF